MWGPLPAVTFVTVAMAWPQTVSPTVASPLAKLTVPSLSVAAGCRLSPNSSRRLSGNRVQSGLWGNLPIQANPWFGSGRSIVAKIRERMLGVPPEPDGPPLDQRSAMQYRLRLADPIDEAYAAFYEDADAQQTGVFALRFRDGERVEPPRPRPGSSDSRLVSWIHRGQLLILIDGVRNACTASIETYVKALRLE